MDRWMRLVGSGGSGAGGVGEAAGEAARSVGELVEGVPLSTQGVMVGLFVGGLVLAVFGRRWMRVGFALIGLLLGAQAGLFLPAAFGLEPAAWLAAAVGGGLGLIVGLLAERAMLVGVMGLSGAVIGPAVAMVVLLSGPGLGGTQGDGVGSAGAGGGSGEVGEGEVGEVGGGGAGGGRSLRSDPLGLGLISGETARRAAREAAEGEAARRGVEEAGAIGDAIERGAADVGRVVSRLAEKVEPYWSALTARERAVVGFAGVAGALLGVAIGALMTGLAGAVVTAYGGVAVALWSGAWLAAAVDPGGAAWLPSGAYVWVGVWLIAGSLCLMLRVGRRTRRRGPREETV